MNKSRFSVDALRRIAGSSVFGRGEAYFRDGRVGLLVVEPARVLAHVKGNESYRAELTGGGTSLNGDCTCRAFEDRGFCKHLVATALAARGRPPRARRKAATRSRASASISLDRASTPWSR
jgi:uncharacterized Zn finger protein